MEILINITSSRSEKFQHDFNRTFNKSRCAFWVYRISNYNNNNIRSAQSASQAMMLEKHMTNMELQPDVRTVEEVIGRMMSTKYDVSQIQISHTC